MHFFVEVVLAYGLHLLVPMGHASGEEELRVKLGQICVLPREALAHGEGGEPLVDDFEREMVKRPG